MWNRGDNVCLYACMYACVFVVVMARSRVLIRYDLVDRDLRWDVL